MKQGRNVDNSENVVLAFQTSGMWSCFRQWFVKRLNQVTKYQKFILTSKVPVLMLYNRVIINIWLNI
jgi:hypothetical protein